MSKYIKYSIFGLIILSSSLSNCLASQIYQKAMLDDESRNKLSRVFIDPITRSNQAEGIHIYPKEEFHMTLKAASAPGNFRNGLAAKTERDVQNNFKFMNKGLKSTVDRAQEALTDVPFTVKGVRIYGKKAKKKFLVCEIAPDLSSLDTAKAAAVRSFMPEGLHVSLARIDNADTGIGQQRTLTLLHKAQETLKQVQTVNPVTGKQRALVVKINQVQADSARNQPLVTGKIMPKKEAGCAV